MVKKKVSNKKVPVSGGMNKNLVVGVVVVLLLVGVFLYFDSQKKVGLMPPMPDTGEESGDMPGAGCKQSGEMCGGTNGECCDIATATDKDYLGDTYDGLPLTCVSSTNKGNKVSFCLPQCTFTKIGRPVLCSDPRYLDKSGKLYVLNICCKANDICIYDDKGFGCSAGGYCPDGSVLCGKRSRNNCCDVRDKDGDRLPDKVCIFIPNPKDISLTSYRCVNLDKKLGICPETKPEMCRITGDYFCTTADAPDDPDDPKSQCSDGIDKCCFAHETCNWDKTFPFENCLPTGKVYCKINGKYSGHACGAGSECCGDKCCKYGQQCNLKNDKYVCEKNPPRPKLPEFDMDDYKKWLLGFGPPRP